MESRYQKLEFQVTTMGDLPQQGEETEKVEIDKQTKDHAFIFFQKLKVEYLLAKKKKKKKKSSEMATVEDKLKSLG
jgi:hypothetical protein